MMQYAVILLLLMGLGGCASFGVWENTGDRQRAEIEGLVEDRSHAGEALNLTGFVPTFTDTFDQMSVTGEQGHGPWYSPGHAPFGAATFVPPGRPESPVFVRNGKLIVQVYQDKKGTFGKKGRWVAGMLQTVNPDGHGFAQQYGYFEMTAQMEPQLGSWGGLWLHSHPALTGVTEPQAELDIAEIYGGDLRGHHSALHLWPAPNPTAGGLKRQADKGFYTKVDGLFQGFHSYGALVTPTYTAFYYDRKELVRTATPQTFKTPLYLLIDMTLAEKQSGHAKGVLEMHVDDVRVWQNPAWATPLMR